MIADKGGLILHQGHRLRRFRPSSPDSPSQAVPFPGRLLAILLCCAAALLAVSAARADEILPFSELKVGMKGEGRSVFQGTQISRFSAEIIGLMENIAPKRNLILVRLSGDPVDRTGVLEGMSGSPVYVNGRVIGAVAYSWGFSKEAIAGVTPIEEMLDVEKRGAGSPGHSRSAPPIPGASPLSALLRPGEILQHFDHYFGAGGVSPEPLASLNPIGTLLSFAGFPGAVIDRLRPDLITAGLVPVQAGVAGKEAAQESADTLVPGAALAVKLVKGDVEISAVGTVTYRDGDRVLAFGHPLLNLGPTSMPMAGAVVHALLPSLNSSFKIASPASGEVGSIQQDRIVAVAGSTAAPARLIPVRVEMTGNTVRAQRFAFDVMEDSFLTPYLIYASLNAILSSAQKDYGDSSVRLQEGSVIKVSGEDDIKLNNLFAGDLAPFYASGTVAYISQLILNNEYHPARIGGINLLLEYSDERRTARVERVWCGKDRVKPGEKVPLTISISPFRGEEITRTFELTIPEDLRPGKVFLQVGDGQAVSRREEEGVPDLHPRDLSQLIWLINHIRPNDRLYVILTRPDNGILFQGTRMPDLPPSKALVMIRPQTEGNFLRVGFRGISEDSIPTSFAVDGYKTLTLEVEERAP
jgi:SpoIVB peptidase S55